MQHESPSVYEISNLDIGDFLDFKKKSGMRAAPGIWRVLASSGGVGCCVLGLSEVETGVLVAGHGLATKGGRHLILRSMEILAVLESELEGRHLPIREAVSEISETDWTTFPICGFRATPWVRKFIRDQDVAPRSWYVR